MSERVGRMSLLVLPVNDPPGPASKRAYIERNAIALLSNVGESPLDAPSTDWLGHDCPRDRVRRSGLWNSNHVDEEYEGVFLDLLE